MSQNYRAFLKLDTSKYPNEYLVFVQGRLVAHGKSLARLLERVGRRFPHQIPCVAKALPQGVFVFIATR